MENELHIRPLLRQFIPWEAPLRLETGSQSHIYPFDTFEFEDPETTPWRTGVEYIPSPGSPYLLFSTPEGTYRPEAFSLSSGLLLELPEAPLSLLPLPNGELWLLSENGLELRQETTWKRLPGHFGTDLVPSSEGRVWLVDRNRSQAALFSGSGEPLGEWPIAGKGRPVAFPGGSLAMIHPGPEEGLALLKPDGEALVDVPAGLEMFSQPLFRDQGTTLTTFGSQPIAYRGSQVFPGPHIQYAGLFAEKTPFFSGRVGRHTFLHLSEENLPLQFELPWEADNVRPYYVYHRDERHYFLRGRGLNLRFGKDGELVDFRTSEDKGYEERYQLEVFPHLYSMGSLRADAAGRLWLPVSGAAGIGIIELKYELREGED